MPAQERLPDDLKDLAFRNGFELSHTRWHSDVREMAQRLGLGSATAPPVATQAKSAPEPIAFSGPAVAAAGPEKPQRITRRRALAAAAVAVAAAGSALAIPSIRRLMSTPSKPVMRPVVFDFASVDAKGIRLPAERASASMFTEKLGSDLGLDMVSVPAGAFTMGSPNYEPERRPNEGPQHLVTLNPFFIGAGPVTQAQWAAVAMAHPAKLSHGIDPFPSFFKGGDLPVECISWNEADEFCHRLAAITGRQYRLPSEAEWEYACRAGSAGPFNVGPTITSELANYCGEGGAVCGDNGGKSVASDVYDGVTYSSGAYDQGPVGTFRGRTTARGTFAPNRFGLYDTHGNIWEYCLDMASPTYADAPTDGSAYLAEPAGGERILRGGSWSHNPAICRSAYRDSIAPDNPGWQGRIGLRVVCAES
jgi:formylglycine-generating enzyme required for sulfatase activity